MGLLGASCPEPPHGPRGMLAKSRPPCEVFFFSFLFSLSLSSFFLFIYIFFFSAWERFPEVRSFRRGRILPASGRRCAPGSFAGRPGAERRLGGGRERKGKRCFCRLSRESPLHKGVRDIWKKRGTSTQSCAPQPGGAALLFFLKRSTLKRGQFRYILICYTVLN